MTVENIGPPVNLMPGDDMLVTVNRPMLVRVVGEHDDEPVDVNVVVEWATLSEMRAEIKELRRENRHLRFRLTGLRFLGFRWGRA